MDGPNLKRMTKKAYKMRKLLALYEKSWKGKAIFLSFILFGFEGMKKTVGFCFFFGYQDVPLHSPPIKQIIIFFNLIQLRNTTLDKF